MLPLALYAQMLKNDTSIRKKRHLLDRSICHPAGIKIE